MAASLGVNVGCRLRAMSATVDSSHSLSKGVRLQSDPCPGQRTLRPRASASASVAVLPFANLSPEKADEYFAEGISEEMLNVLAKIPGLRVSARTASFQFKGKDTPTREIGRQLSFLSPIQIAMLGTSRSAANNHFAIRRKFCAIAASRNSS
jgi:hypothetical protein